MTTIQLVLGTCAVGRPPCSSTTWRRSRVLMSNGNHGLLPLKTESLQTTMMTPQRSLVYNLRPLELQRCSFNSIWRARRFDDEPISSPVDFCCQSCITRSVARLNRYKIYREQFGAVVKHSPKENKGQNRDFTIEEQNYYFRLCKYYDHGEHDFTQWQFAQLDSLSWTELAEVPSVSTSSKILPKFYVAAILAGIRIFYRIIHCLSRFCSDTILR